MSILLWIENFYRKHLRIVVLLFFILLIWIIRLLPVLGEGYALHVYPFISSALSSFSSLFPFSLGDAFICLSMMGVLVYPFVGWYRRTGWKKVLLQIGEFLGWIYVWFYLAWGLNYFRQDFYTRTQLHPVAYSAENFHGFLEWYVNELNESYIPVKWVESSKVEEEVRNGYLRIYTDFGLCKPRGWQRPKTMLFTPFISKVGVSGYMGPFFCEFNLNGDLLASQYPNTYAHEMAHLLGIGNEAEANLYAFLVCTSSKDPHIRFSGYFSLFSHVIRNARYFLEEEEYSGFVEKINPSVIQLYQDNRAYWSEKYSPLIGEVQDRIYDWFLKGNNISTGRENYSQVISLLIALNNFEK